MIGGPVFLVELLTTSRRARYYATRSVYVIVLLALLFSTYESTFFNVRRGVGGEVPVASMNLFGARLFATFASVQGVAVFLITPVLVAGTIAVESQRKTLLYLLASDLSGSDVVLGKLLSRLLHLGVFLLIGLPLYAILTFFGGVSVEMILAVYALTISGGLYLAGVSIYASVMARRGRDAIFLAYAIVAAWYVVPIVVASLVAIYVPDADGWIGSTLLCILPGAGAYLVLLRLPFPTMFFTREMMFGISIAQLVLFGTGLTAVAAWRLRRVAARGDGRRKLRIGLDNRGRMTARVIPKPPCPDRFVMLWKERYTSQVGGWARLILGFAQIVVVVGIGCLAIDPIRGAIDEAFRAGFSPSAVSRDRIDFSRVLRGSSVLLFIAWQLAVAFAAASSVSGEHEEDTWTNLTSSTLTGREILRAKRLGAIARYRSIAIVLLVLHGFGLATGTVHPIGFAVEAALFAGTLALIASLGVYQSLKSKTTMRALCLTLIPLFLIDGGYLLCCLPFPPGKFYDFLVAIAPVRLAGAACLSYDDVRVLAAGPPWSPYTTTGTWEDVSGARDMLAASMVMLSIYVAGTSIAAWLLAWLADGEFPAVAGRADGFPRAQADEDQADRGWMIFALLRR